MEKMRQPFQGVWNIIRFNWQFYVLSGGFVLLLLLFYNCLDASLAIYILIIGLLVLLPIIISLVVSYYVYDLSGLYELKWIDNNIPDDKIRIININAGFDETSILLQQKFPNAELEVLDFYDPEKHTEVSIKRARKAYPPFPGTKSVTATHLPVADNIADKIFVIFAAHEIRDENERINFFKELKRIIKPTEEIIMTEHLRDLPNFMAYNIGFLHFYSKPTWYRVFQSAGLIIKKEQKVTPFISTFTLTK
jgi:ubiquinone/menaquinone biosynthesis C-methylase UbiE